MKYDYLDATLYSTVELFNPVYMGKPFKTNEEENNMDIPGKLREDLKRIYGASDPLNYIEDITITQGPCDSEIHMTLRVPDRYERFVKSSPLYGDHYSMDRWIRQFGCVCGIDEGAQKAPEENPVEMNKCEEPPVKFSKPDRVVFSGPKTILFWPDGSKTMVSVGEGESYDEYTAFCAAVVKKLFGATHKAKKFLEAVKVIQKPKVKVKKGYPIEVDYTVVDGEKKELVPMPGTTEPDWGEKHWGSDTKDVDSTPEKEIDSDLGNIGI